MRAINKKQRALGEKASRNPVTFACLRLHDKHIKEELFPERCNNRVRCFPRLSRLPKKGGGA